VSIDGLRRVNWAPVLRTLIVGAIVVIGLRQIRRDIGVTAADAEGYWQAALRLRDGAPLYFNLPNTGDPTLYRYAPWFAFAWVPLTLLPHGPVMTAWVALQAAALAYLVWPLRTSLAGIGLAFLVGSMLVRTVLIGQVHVLMLAGLAWGLHRRSGPVVIAVAASLKIFPLLFALTYVRRREWGRLALTLGLTAALWAPLLLFDLSDFPEGGFNPQLPLPLLLGGAAVASIVALRSERYGDLGVALAIILGNPRYNHYTPGYLLVPRPR